MRVFNQKQVGLFGRLTMLYRMKVLTIMALVVALVMTVDQAVAQEVFDRGAQLLDDTKVGLLGWIKTAAFIVLIVLAIHGMVTRRFQWAWMGTVAGGLVIVAAGEAIVDWLFAA